MTANIYNVSMLIGLLLASAGASIVGGIGIGLIVAGILLLFCTVVSALVTL